LLSFEGMGLRAERVSLRTQRLMLWTGWRNFETTPKFLLHGFQPRK
jgi:hypothetical protein